jgi:Protein of unknown function (DUF2934)
MTSKFRVIFERAAGKLRISLFFSPVSREFSRRRPVWRDYFHHQVVRANRRDFLRHRIARHFRGLRRHQGLDQVVRERAYLLWEQAGRPDGRADDFWHQAQHERFCERAYALWEREGCPEGKADEHWFRTRAFEET